MYNDIDSIVLVFENVDSTEIPMQDIAVLELDGIKQIARRTYGTNIIRFSAHLTHFALRIKANGNKICYPFGFTDLEPYTLFNRITQHKDIVSVIIKHNDGTEIMYDVDWGGETDEENNYQKSYIDKDGMLVVVVEAQT